MNECLDNLAEAMSRFGSLVPPCHQELVDKVLPLLDDNRAALRRRAMHCISEWLLPAALHQPGPPCCSGGGAGWRGRPPAGRPALPARPA